ncbi:MAG: hypothetical protein GY714_28185 [Desulfobacterales bacterium]|nr:hypothetical protein [Desulfobacterales bacterium]MCP4161855.1 hypothetical protein [Deltaproteobacteria bacterium]
MKKIITFFIISILLVCFESNAETIIHNKKAKNKLLGKHLFALQWIGWKNFGTVIVHEKDGTIYIKGKQKGISGEAKKDFVSIDGIITSVKAKEFTFKGDIITKVYHISDGIPCKRSGSMTFKIKGYRKYWRLQSTVNPCQPEGSSLADYIDIFKRK